MAALKPFLRWLATPFGAAITLYALNIVAWGGMLFLLLCNAAPAMCVPTCTDIDSPRRVWIETDAQILNALFCVTGFGLAPWRVRDLFWWAAWRCGMPVPRCCRAGAAGGRCGWWGRWWRGGSCRGKGGDDYEAGVAGDAGGNEGLRRLAYIHGGWFRLPPSALDDGAPADLELKSTVDTDDAGPIRTPSPKAAATATEAGRPRASATPRWKLDFVIWTALLNTVFQVALASIMWSLDRFTRPSWATGLLVALACAAGAASGGMIYFEQRRVKKVEGVAEPVPAAVQALEGVGEEAKTAV